MSSTVGHHHQRQALERLLRADRLPSAMMFAGAAGIGKRRCALELAATIFCESFRNATSRASTPYGGCQRCKGCSVVNSGNCPDLITLDCASDTGADIDALRELLHTVNMRTFLGGARIVLFDNAESLSVQGANLLLKSFEEPRPGNHFILLASNPSALPATLLSRCQIWFFDRLSDDEVVQVLKSSGNEKDSASVASLADGSLAQLAALREEAESFTSLKDDLQRIARGDTAYAITLAQTLAKDKERLPVVFSLLRTAVRGELLKAGTAEESSRWAILLQNVLTAERLILERNLNGSLVLANTFIGLATPATFTRLNSGGTVLDGIVI